MQQPTLKGYDIAIIGGDRREVFLAEELLNRGANVWLYGFLQFKLPIEQRIKQTLPKKVDIIILPLPGVLADHSIYSAYTTERIYFAELNHLLQSGVLLFCGKMPDFLRQQLQEQGLHVILASDLAELTIFNAVPTAEGVLEIAMRESQITFNNSSVLITGFGSCAQQLARISSALGAKVTVVARKQKDITAAKVLGYDALNFTELTALMSNFNFIFNTVPNLVLNKEVLLHVRKSVLLYDIASAPGGTDFAAAQELGLQARLLPGLPGKVAPLTVGKQLAEVYDYYINLHRKED
ncbi:MAG TPA: dipicolinate synthase subunit DpsA [Oscillospiraceae bacterium]|nr:dipicolinate synthase subunit DpsA [Oscillospiraceae bacterium]